MTNVDIALISGHDLKNDNIDLLRAIGTNDKIEPHSQLLKLFEHYKYVLSSNGRQDTVVYRASMIWVYSEFYRMYKSRTIYRESMDKYDNPNETFFKDFLLNVDPMLISLAFNSVSYLYFCTKEYILVEKIITRLKFLSAIWQRYTMDIRKHTITLPGPYILEAIWVEHLPTIDKINDTNNFPSFLPRPFIVCLGDLLVAANLFETDTPYNPIPDSGNYSVYLRICMTHIKNITDLITVLQRINSTVFDLDSVFRGLHWECTHKDLCERLQPSKTGYYNPHVWLILSYLCHNGQLTITAREPHVWNVSERSLGQAMFDYHAYHNKDSIFKFLNLIQYNKNRSFNTHSKEIFIGLIKKYREFGMALDVKKLKIKRGILLNFLAAGFGDIFCVD